MGPDDEAAEYETLRDEWTRAELEALPLMELSRMLREDTLTVMEKVRISEILLSTNVADRAHPGKPSAAKFGQSSVQVQGGGETKPEPEPTGPGSITRLDKFNVSVDGVTYRATEEQEARIRTLTREQRVKFHEVMGNPGVKVPTLWRVTEMDRKGVPKIVNVEAHDGKIIITRVRRSQHEYRCKNVECPNPIMPTGSAYMNIRDPAEQPSRIYRFHPACAPYTVDKATALLYPDGVPKVEKGAQGVLDADKPPTEAEVEVFIKDFIAAAGVPGEFSVTGRKAGKTNAMQQMSIEHNNTGPLMDPGYQEQRAQQRRAGL